jgi:hypothetical protein
LKETLKDAANSFGEVLMVQTEEIFDKIDFFIDIIFFFLDIGLGLSLLL